MGRKSTGIVLNTSALRINIDELKRWKVYNTGKDLCNSISWNTGNSINIETFEDKDFIEVAYMTNEQNFRYKIYICKIRSNLGKGFNHYFICPKTKRLCKILYLTYGATQFCSRKGYQNRIYYRTQKSSNLSYYLDRYWQVKERIEVIMKKKVVCYYKGKKTKKAYLLERLFKEESILDEQRFTLGMPKSLKKIGFVC